MVEIPVDSNKGEESELSGSVDHAEINIYSHAVGPFFDLQTGVRVDLEPNNRTHFVIGLQGLAPYMFHVDGAFFLMTGDLTGKIKGEYDQNNTAINIAAQNRIGLFGPRYSRAQYWRGNYKNRCWCQTTLRVRS